MSILTFPITLITGTPGTGKTSLAVSFLLDTDRPIYTNIKDFALNHEKFPNIEDFTISTIDRITNTNKYNFNFPKNSILVIDEAQTIFRPRASGSKVPPQISAFETIRHDGISCILITQHPSLIDANLRKLVNNHIHIKDIGLLGRHTYTFPECSDLSSFSSAIRSKYKLNKKTFDKYSSTELNIKRKYNVHPSILMIGVFLVALPFSIYFFNKKINPQKDVPQSKLETQKTDIVNIVQTPIDKIENISRKIAFYNKTQEIPINNENPNSAPIYDNLRRVTDYPRYVGGYCIDTKCKCFSQQNTLLDISNDVCLGYVMHKKFNDYRLNTDYIDSNFGQLSQDQLNQQNVDLSQITSIPTTNLPQSQAIQQNLDLSQSLPPVNR